MWLISEESGTSIEKTFAMIAGNGIHSWLDILKRLLLANGKEWLWDEFKKLKLQQSIDDAHTARNAIVHAAWNSPTRDTKLLELASPITKPPMVAEGIGFKKKGSQIAISVKYSAAEMREVAKKTQAIRKELLLWSAMPSPEQKKQLRAQALLTSRRKRRTPSRQ